MNSKILMHSFDPACIFSALCSKPCHQQALENICETLIAKKFTCQISADHWLVSFSPAGLKIAL